MEAIKAELSPPESIGDRKGPPFHTPLPSPLWMLMRIGIIDSNIIDQKTRAGCQHAGGRERTYVILSASEESHALGTEILRWRSE